MSSSSSACKLAFAFALAFTACSSAPAQDVALNGAPPLLGNQVGPSPGPEETAPQLANPLDGDTAAAQAGRILFDQYNCSGCHGGHGGGGSGPSLRDDEWIYGESDAAVYGAIADGRARGMPAWGSRVPELQVWQLVTYIRSLGQLNEIAAPSELIPPPPPPSAFNTGPR